MSKKSIFTVLTYVLGIILIVQALRIFFPSLITVFELAFNVFESMGTEHPEQMGLMAILLFLSAFLMIGLAYLIKPHRLVVIAGSLFVISTLILQTSHGGVFQWYMVATTLALGLYWFVLQAMIPADNHLVAIGIASGIVSEVILHNAMGTMDLVWLHGALPWILQIIICGLFLFALFTNFRNYEFQKNGGNSHIWFIIGPVLFITGSLASSGSRAEVVTADWPYPVATVILLVVMVAGLFLVLRGGLIKKHPWLTGILMLIAAGLASFPTEIREGIVQIAPDWTFYFQLLLIVSILSAFGHIGSDKGEASPLKKGLAAATGMFIFVLLMFGFYGTFELILGFPRNYLFLLASLIIGFSVWRSHSKRESTNHLLLENRKLIISYGISILTILVIGLVSLSFQKAPVAKTTTEVTYPVRVMTYNIRMGYSFDGRFNPQALADDINNSGADIVALNEVDRGWFLNGEHDILGMLSALTDMPYVWAPSAGSLWGNAILSKAPVNFTESTLLPQTDPIQGVSLKIIVELADGEELGVITAHQQSEKFKFSETVVNDAQQLSENGKRPVVMMGDFNMRIGDEELEAISSRFHNALESDEEILTFSSKYPVKHIDHIFVTEELISSDILLTDSIASDHRGVSVTLEKKVE